MLRKGNNKDIVKKGILRFCKPYRSFEGGFSRVVISLSVDMKGSSF